MTAANIWKFFVKWISLQLQIGPDLLEIEVAFIIN